LTRKAAFPFLSNLSDLPMQQYGISPQRFQENEHLSSFFKILTNSADEDNQVMDAIILWCSFLYTWRILILFPTSILGLCLHCTSTQLSCDCLPMASRGIAIMCFALEPLCFSVEIHLWLGKFHTWSIKYGFR
jgi:hypothetical protein